MKFKDLLNEKDDKAKNVEKVLKKISDAFSLTRDFARDVNIAVAHLRLTKKELKPLERKIINALNKIDIQVIGYNNVLRSMGVTAEVPKDKNAVRDWDIRFEYRKFI